ncbi:M56 family metallopeptidase [Nocardioides nematodiphilus]|uniref:M56 family metallopeptidase n=1 Tax=Nocardioides nematodiphilus TaxID=2849669 RepID=UPI001CD92442|nr:M56 family metallopeptidase [Nocardioides nematodiphilus]MCA1984817.1 M56 family metallopeptidase [Nocardioides nematodiphilus]
MIAELVAAGCLLLLYAAAVMVATPYVVTHRRWTSQMPRTAMSLWIGALGSGGVAMLASLGCAIWAATDLASRPRQASTLSVSDALNGIGLTLVACLMTAIGGGLIGVLAYRAAVNVTFRRQLRAGLVAAVAPTSGSRPRTAPTIVVRSDQSSAVSIPGRKPVIVISSNLRDTLSPEHLDAVVEHERGHLVQRHHLLMQLAHLQYRCVPGLPCARSLEQSLQLLVELAADDHAARRCGRRTTATALRALARATGDDGLRLRAHRLETRTRSSRTQATHG